MPAEIACALNGYPTCLKSEYIESDDASEVNQASPKRSTIAMEQPNERLCPLSFQDEIRY